MKKELEKEILSIISKIIQVPEEEIGLEASFFDEYGMDSLRALEILAEVENKYHITIAPEKLMQMTNAGEVIKITREYLEENNG